MAAFRQNFLQHDSAVGPSDWDEVLMSKEQGARPGLEFKACWLDLGLIGNQLDNLLGQWLGIQVLLMVEIGLETEVG